MTNRTTAILLAISGLLLTIGVYRTISANTSSELIPVCAPTSTASTGVTAPSLPAHTEEDDD